MLKTENFDVLAGTNKRSVNSGVPYGFRIEGITFDGQNPKKAAGDGLKIYGKRYILRDVVLVNIPGVGIHSECGSGGGTGAIGDAMPEAIALEQARDLVNSDINSVSLPNEARVAWQEEDDRLRVFANGDSACFTRDTLPALIQLCDAWTLTGESLAALRELDDGCTLLTFLIHMGALHVE